MGKSYATLSVWALAAALPVVFSTSRARGEPLTGSNIPDPRTAATNAMTNELPLPYDPWQGATRLPTVPAHEREQIQPLARARELPRRTWEMTVALTALLPRCGAGSRDDRGCTSVRPGSGTDVALLYRPNPFFSVGAEAVLGGWPQSSVRARFGGIVGRLHFVDHGVWDPYLALTLGAGQLTLARGEGATTGLGGRVAGGIDYLLGPHWRIGPAASFAHWLAWNEQQCVSGTCRDAPLDDGRLLGFATLGVRVTASFGEVL